MWQLRDKKRLIYNNQTAFRNLSKRSTEYFFLWHIKDIFNIYICGFALMNKLGHRSIVSGVQCFEDKLWLKPSPCE